MRGLNSNERPKLDGRGSRLLLDLAACSIRETRFFSDKNATRLSSPLSRTGEDAEVEKSPSFVGRQEALVADEDGGWRLDGGELTELSLSKGESESTSSLPPSPSSSR